MPWLPTVATAHWGRPVLEVLQQQALLALPLPAVVLLVAGSEADWHRPLV